MRFAWHFLRDPIFRRDHVLRLRLRPERGQFQYRSFTREDRAPRIFAFLGEQLGAKPEARVLSFGCATGEEVFSLRRCLPHAIIKGIDVNARDIAAAERRRGEAADSRMEFVCAASADEEAAASYDAVLCLAVFQHSALKDGAHDRCADFIHFEDFERVLSGLARCLKPGGYLAIRWANFRFEDAACAADFRSALTLPPGGAAHPGFGHDNLR